MIDALFAQLERAKVSTVREELGVDGKVLRGADTASPIEC